MAATSTRVSLERLRAPVLRRHRRALQPSTRPRPLPLSPLRDEEWPADEAMQSYLVGASPEVIPVSAASAAAAAAAPPAAPPRNFGRIRSAQSLASTSTHTSPASHPRRLGSHRVERGRVSSVFARSKGSFKRSNTEMDKEVFSGDGNEMENSCYSMSATVVEERGRAMLAKTALEVGKRGETFQGYCRMAWFAGIRCTRFLRLIKGRLQCYDSNIRKRLWDVPVEGARVRVHAGQKRMVLSKLKRGVVVEFFLYDVQSCREWGAALLRASSRTGEEVMEY